MASQRTPGQRVGPLRCQPGVELLQDRHGQVLAHLQPQRLARDQRLGLALDLVQLPGVSQRLAAAQRGAAARLVELAPRRRVAGHFDDGRGAGPRVRQLAGS